MQRIPILWKANTIAFSSSFCVMVIELVAARILAPYIGVSLYTWTSIIGVILAGIALGNYLGGKIADKFASPSLLVTVLFAGTLAALSILPISKAIGPVHWFSNLHLMLNSTLVVACIFLLPAIILSMISPLVIKLTLADLGKTGGVVGTIYAFSTTGSILGTFMTGFYFILWFGTRTTVWLVVAILMLTAILVWLSWKMPHRWIPTIQNIVIWVLATLIILSTIVLFTFPESWQQKYTRESNYYSIQILTYGDRGDDTIKSSSVKMLVLDHLIHSYVVLEDPTFFQYDYLKIFSGLVKYSTRENSKPAILHLGGGGYSFPKYMELTYPGSLNDVIEIDPEVTEVAYQELGLSRETSIITYNQDARIFLQNQSTNDKYDFVIGDVFNDLTTPYHLTTLEFDKLIRASMKDGGIYLVNIIDSYKDGQYMPAFINTLKHAFKYVYLLSNLADYESASGSTFVIAATDRHIDLDDFISFISKSEKYSRQIYAPDETRLENYLAEKNPILLTDDYAPTDILVAPLFRLRSESR